jgi:hypothetical protein
VTTVRGRMSSRFRNCPKRSFFQYAGQAGIAPTAPPSYERAQQRSTQSLRETLLTQCRRMFELTQHRHEFNCRRRAYNCFQGLGTKALDIRILVVATFVGQKSDAYDRPQSSPMKFERMATAWPAPPGSFPSR